MEVDPPLGLSESDGEDSESESDEELDRHGAIVTKSQPKRQDRNRQYKYTCQCCVFPKSFNKGLNFETDDRKLYEKHIDSKWHKKVAEKKASEVFGAGVPGNTAASLPPASPAGASGDAWNSYEDEILVEAHEALGNQWALIAKQLPGRSNDACKNHFQRVLMRRAGAGHLTGKAKPIKAEKKPPALAPPGGASSSDPITACQPPPSAKGRHVREEAFGAGKKLQGLEAGMMLQRTGKRSNQAYINARCDALHGRTVGFAIRNFRYYDNKRAAANYALGDLAYDITAGRLVDPRLVAGGGSASTLEASLVPGYASQADQEDEEEATETTKTSPKSKSPLKKAASAVTAGGGSSHGGGADGKKLKSPIGKKDTGKDKVHPFFAGNPAKKPSRAPPKVKKVPKGTKPKT